MTECTNFPSTELYLSQASSLPLSLQRHSCRSPGTLAQPRPSPGGLPPPTSLAAAAMGLGAVGGLTPLEKAAVLPQAGILYIREPKGLNFKGGEKQRRMTFVKFP